MRVEHSLGVEHCEPTQREPNTESRASTQSVQPAFCCSAMKDTHKSLSYSSPCAEQLVWTANPSTLERCRRLAAFSTPCELRWSLELPWSCRCVERVRGRRHRHIRLELFSRTLPVVTRNRSLLRFTLRAVMGGFTIRAYTHARRQRDVLG